MHTENKEKRPGRPMIQVYCLQEIKEAVDGHEWLHGCTIGNEKAQKILDALNFAAKWSGRVAELENGQLEDQSALISEQEDAIERLQVELKSSAEDLSLSREQVIDLRGQIAVLEQQLTAMQQTLSTAQEGNEKLGADNQQLELRLKETADRLRDLEAEELNWAKISSVIDPAYRAVIEEITRRLATKYELPELDPLTVLVTFFLKYYYNQEVEFSGMPFVINQREVFAIVSDVYPNMDSKTLKKALTI